MFSSSVQDPSPGLLILLFGLIPIPYSCYPPLMSFIYSYMFLVFISSFRNVCSRLVTTFVFLPKYTCQGTREIMMHLILCGGQDSVF